MNGIEKLVSLLELMSVPKRLGLVLMVTLAAHIMVLIVRRLGLLWMRKSQQHKHQKLMSISTLVTSSLIFGIYFSAAGFTLSEFGVPIGTYFASATIIGLAVGFGSQGLVQDVVSGLTTIFSSVFDVGDMVEISSQTGIVRNIGLRFVEIENSFGARVLIPNRSITNVVHYTRGYVRCIVDVTLPRSQEKKVETIKLIESYATGVYEQYPGILLTPPTNEGEQSTSGGRAYLRLKFRIWPGRGTPIEQSFKPEIIQAMKQLDSDYGDWMIAVHYEVESKKLINH